MTTYIIERRGASNACNSLGTVGTVEARGKQAAKKAAAEKFSLYNGQYFVATLASRRGREANREAALADEYWRAEEEHLNQIAETCRD